MDTQAQARLQGVDGSIEADRVVKENVGARPYPLEPARTDIDALKIHGYAIDEQLPGGNHRIPRVLLEEFLYICAIWRTHGTHYSTNIKHWRKNRNMSGLDDLNLLHVDLASNGGGDEGGAALLQELDGPLRLGDQGVELGGLPVEVGGDGFLFRLGQ